MIFNGFNGWGFFFMCRWAAAQDISQKNNIIGDHIIVIINTLEWI